MTSQEETIRTRRLSAEDEEMYASPNSSPPRKEVRKISPGLANTRENRRFAPQKMPDVALHDESINCKLLELNDSA
jgi:hypothetical protein